MKLVLDASVLIKWFAAEDEDFQQEAKWLYKKIQTGEVDILLPVHWQAEVIAVLTRLMPEHINQLIPVLDALEFDVVTSVNTYQRAAELSVQMNHHLFDTLYHAVALNREIVLVTDDRKYFNKAQALGNICLLKDVQNHLKSA